VIKSKKNMGKWTQITEKALQNEYCYNIKQ